MHGGQRAGSGGGDDSQADVISQVRVGWGERLTQYNFCELEPAGIRGFVFVDGNGDCLRDADEPPLEGVTIELRDASGRFISRTTTDANGQYIFHDLTPGQYQIFEMQPEGFFHGGQTPGTGDGEVLGTDLLGVTLLQGDRLVNYNFCEVEPAGIMGIVHVDNDGDCIPDAGEEALEGVPIELRDASGNVVARTVTNADGRYNFEGLKPGEYQVFAEQADGLFHGGQKVGTGDGEVLGIDLLGVNLGPGEQLINYDFCEVPPASIAGKVWHESDPNQVFEPGDTPIPGVLIELIDEAGDTVASTRTNADGDYSFMLLEPGVYSVRETQPSGFFHGGEVLGDVGGEIGGDDLLVGITLLPGVHADHYNFPEVPPATLSGFVFQDGDTLRLEASPAPEDLRDFRDGLLTADDTRLGGVRLELRNVLGLPFDASRALPGVYADGPIQTTTDASGFYEFTGLRPGTYHVYQVQPEEFIDGLDSAGTTGGFAVNPADALQEDDRIMIQTLAFSELTDPKDDAILNITLVGGGASENNNFSEIAITPPDVPQVEVPQPEVVEAPPQAAVPLVAFDPRIRVVTYVDPLPDRDLSILTDEWAVSWHLSVINGGTPRGSLGDEGIFRSISARNMRKNWTEGENASGSWKIVRRDGSVMPLSRDLTLGVEDGIALAGDFDGDGSDEAVIYAAGQWFVDLNGNGRWDAGDLWIRLGTELDRPVIGDWDGDGKDDIAIFGRQWLRDPQRIKRDPGLPDPANQRRRQVDARTVSARGEDRGEDRRRLMRRGNDGSLRADAVDHVFQYGEQVDTPISGDWNGDGIDQIAVFRNGRWLLDADGDGRWTQRDEDATFGRPGDEPIVGDFNGDDIDEIGVVRGDLWIIDTDGDRRITGNDLRIVVPREGEDSQPVVGDWDGDGKDDPGYYDEAA